MTLHDLNKELRHRLIPTADQFWDNARYWDEMGYRSFTPELSRQTLFSSDEDISIHTRCVIETAKEMIANGPDHSSLVDGPFTNGWESPFLHELREERRKRTGLTFATERGWVMELDPCVRKTRFLESTGDEEYLTRAKELTRLAMQFRDQEIAKIGSNDSGMFSFGADDRVRFYMYVTGRQLEPYGYVYDKRASGKLSPVFSKRVSGWKYVWAVEPRLLASLTDCGGLQFRCQLYPDKCRTSELTNANWHAEMPHLFAFPLSHLFRKPYFKFNSLAELAVVISAHVEAYSRIDEYLSSVTSDLTPRWTQ